MNERSQGSEKEKESSNSRSLDVRLARREFCSGMGICFLGAMMGGAAGCRPVQEAGTLPWKSASFPNLKILGTRGTALGQFNKPRSLALDRQDCLYVADLTGRVQKFSTEGDYLLYWQMPETELGKPKGMICDTAGNIVVVEPHYSRINHFTTDGNLVSQWGKRGTGPGEFTVPRGVAIRTDGQMYVCEYSYRERVQAFAPRTREFVHEFGRPGSKDGEFNRPEGLFVDSQARIWVADSCNHRIQVFDDAGRWLQSFGRPGSGPGELSYPYDVLLDSRGRVFVCEFGNSRIQIFDRKLRSLETIGSLGDRPGQFFNPWAIALDSQENLYVADGGNHRVQIFLRPT